MKDEEAGEGDEHARELSGLIFLPGSVGKA
jgi:hypothetical protein